MKKFALIILCSFLSTLSWSQGFEWGFEGGPTRTDVKIFSDDQELEFDPTWGQFYSISFQNNLSKHFVFRMNVAYERTGLRPKAELFDENLVVSLYWDYVKVPLFVKFRTQGKLQYHAQVGPYIGFLLRSSEISKDTDSKERNIARYTDQWNRLDFGISGGMGLSYISESNFVFSLQGIYSLGLYEVDSKESIFNPIQIKNQSISILAGLGYRFVHKEPEIE